MNSFFPRLKMKYAAAALVLAAAAAVQYTSIACFCPVFGTVTHFFISIKRAALFPALTNMRTTA